LLRDCLMPCQACKEFKEKHVRYKTQVASGNPTDYTQPCTLNLSMPCPDARIPCTVNGECAEGTCPSGQCPAPLANSHLETGCSSAGVITVTCAFCLTALPRKCRTAGTCLYNGTCGYECDVGYIWNPVTLTCDLIPVSAGASSGNSVIVALAALASWIRRRKKRVFIATLK